MLFLLTLPVRSGYLRTQVNQHGVIVRTTGNDCKTTVYQGLCQYGSILLNLFCIFLVFRLQDFAESYGFGSDYVFQRSALYTWNTAESSN